MAQDLWNQNQDETYANEPGNMDQRRGFFGNGGAATPFEQMAAGFNADMAAESLSTYIAKTFLWMFAGLLVTFLVVYGMAVSGVAYSMLAGAGIALFLGYTAYDVSKVRENYYFYAGQGELLKKASIFSALQLYLDFINLFLYILRILGNRKD